VAFPMDSGFRLSPSKQARLIIYQSHCERLLSDSWVDNMPGRHKRNDKVDKRERVLLLQRGRLLFTQNGTDEGRPY
jgi:hypothetical protein